MTFIWLHFLLSNRVSNISNNFSNFKINWNSKSRIRQLLKFTKESHLNCTGITRQSKQACQGNIWVTYWQISDLLSAGHHNIYPPSAPNAINPWTAPSCRSLPVDLRLFLPDGRLLLLLVFHISEENEQSYRRTVGFLFHIKCKSIKILLYTQSIHKGMQFMMKVHPDTDSIE